ncbi:MAG: glycoside hydrolase family 57 [Acidobacteriaceae bacterium]|nr:glycoside hydrolase family 57 [Acidobacteriaceae bacterium]
MPSKIPNSPGGYVTITLHSHLPYVINHGTWPHGLEWLSEAAAETYLPLLRVIGRLEREGIYLKPNINLSPILLEQLAHPVFKSEFVEYLNRKIEAALKDKAEYTKKGDTHMAKVAEYWRDFFSLALKDFEALGRDIISGFRRFNDSGAIEVFTCAATHGYFPLLGTDASIRAQVRTGVETHKKHFGKAPRGIWIPECGYRPAGVWDFPVSPNGASPTAQFKPYYRAGVEQILAENGIQYFFIDTHLVENSAVFTPYEHLAGNVPVAVEKESGTPRASFYQPFFADTPDRSKAQVAFFTRDPRTSVQVWSGDHGYPGDADYLDFHKKKFPGGHRYWRVTGPRIDLGDKTPYYPNLASDRARDHAADFARITAEAIKKYPTTKGVPPILTAPFDAELFGHWWFEGPQFLENVAREFAKPESELKLVTCGEYLDRFPPKGFLELSEGSWGKNGTNEVWLNPDTAWTWKHIYPAEMAVHQMAETGKWRGNEAATRLAKQVCRELLLLESSDWQFLITTGAARDYAELRFDTHLQQFRDLIDAWRRFESTNEISGEAMNTLEIIEERDSVFADIKPELWAR